MIKLLILIPVVFAILLFTYAYCMDKSEKKKLRNTKKTSAKSVKLCSRCATGKKSYILDPHSEACPYISSYKNGDCSYFKSEKSKIK